MNSTSPHNPYALGHKKQCDYANEWIKDLVGSAREAWYSSNPPIKREFALEYRKHPARNEYFSLMEWGNDRAVWPQIPEYGGRYTVRVSVLRDDGTAIKVYVYTWPDNLGSHNRDHMKALDNKPATRSADIGHTAEFLHEGFTTYIRDPDDYRHKCLDGSIKELAFYDHRDVRLTPKVTSLKVYLKSEAKLFERDGEQIRSRLWKGFLRNEHKNEHIAFEHLSQLETACADKSGFDVKQVRKWNLIQLYDYYKLVPKSGRYFRRVSSIEIEEYKPEARSGKYKMWQSSAVAPQNNLSLRQKKHYSFNLDRSEDIF
ncbi:hypothetical protein JCM5353_002579 [Sporobolomyces roseus]